MSKHHNLKVTDKNPDELFRDLLEKRMSCSIRNNDRKFKPGDTITFREGYSKPGVFHYSGRSVNAVISFITTRRVIRGYVCLHLTRVGVMLIGNPHKT